jgi:hypothetical protein
MKFKKVVQTVDGKTLVYFVDQEGNKQGELMAYNVSDPVLIRQENLLYTQVYKDNILINEFTPEQN